LHRAAAAVRAKAHPEAHSRGLKSTAEQVVERGASSLQSLLSMALFTIAPTIIDLLLVSHPRCAASPRTGASPYPRRARGARGAQSPRCSMMRCARCVAWGGQVCVVLLMASEAVLSGVVLASMLLYGYATITMTNWRKKFRRRARIHTQARGWWGWTRASAPVRAKRAHQREAAAHDASAQGAKGNPSSAARTPPPQPASAVATAALPPRKLDARAAAAARSPRAPEPGAAAARAAGALRGRRAGGMPA
jgi:hypothetical protein